MAAPLVCRRWRQLVNSAPLLQLVEAEFSDVQLLQLRSFCEWVLLRAAHHVQRLGISLRLSGEESASLLAAAVAACGAAGSLVELRLKIFPPDGERFTCSSWMAALRSLRRLTVQVAGILHVAASLQPLAALEDLKLKGVEVELPQAARLPVSLTRLFESCFEDSLPGQVRPLSTPCMLWCAVQ